MAVVLDRLWVDAARVELLTAAEAAALAGVAELATDDHLRESLDAADTAADVRTAALLAAAQNRVAGRPLSLADDDVRIGRIVQDPAGRDVFLETDQQPTNVAVFARRQRSGPNPVSLFLRAATGAPEPAVTVAAEAGIDNRIVGVATISGGCIPALPLAALESETSGAQSQTWVNAIEQHGGGDRFRYDADSGLVVAESDGLPELVLLSAAANASPAESVKCNVRCLDLGTGLRDDRCATQVDRGLAERDLDAFSGELRFDNGVVDIFCDAHVGDEMHRSLTKVVGEPRICFLFAAAGEPDVAAIPRIVAVRVMSVRVVDGDRVEIVVQPTVVRTRTAVLGDAATASNPYIYKLQLTQ